MMSIRSSRGAGAGLLVLLLVPSGTAQQPGQPGSGSPPRNTSRSQPDRTFPGLNPQQDRTQQTVYLSGEVVLEDGSPPPFGVVIERDCSGRVTREASVQVDGHFSFQLGGGVRSGDIADASESSADPFGNVTRPPSLPSGSTTLSTNLRGCELRARLAGYRSSSVNLDTGPLVGILDVGTIVLYPTSRVPGALVSAVNLQAPKAAQKALERGNKALEKNDLEGAEANLKSAVELYPKYVEAWFQLGRTYERRKRYEDARDCYGKSIAIDAAFVRPYVQLARLAGLQQKWQEVVDLTDRALGLDPVDFPEAYFYSAVANYWMNRLDAAEKSARREEMLDGTHRIPRIHILLADILDRKNDPTGAAEELRKYLAVAPAAPDAAQIRARIEEKEKPGAGLPPGIPQLPHP
jgi:hypothetical protein